MVLVWIAVAQDAVSNAPVRAWERGEVCIAAAFEVYLSRVYFLDIWESQLVNLTASDDERVCSGSSFFCFFPTGHVLAPGMFGWVVGEDDISSSFQRMSTVLQDGIECFPPHDNRSAHCKFPEPPKVTWEIPGNGAIDSNDAIERVRHNCADHVLPRKEQYLQTIAVPSRRVKNYSCGL